MRTEGVGSHLERTTLDLLATERAVPLPVDILGQCLGNF